MLIVRTDRSERLRKTNATRSHLPILKDLATHLHPSSRCQRREDAPRACGPARLRSESAYSVPAHLSGQERTTGERLVLRRFARSETDVPFGCIHGRMQSSVHEKRPARRLALYRSTFRSPSIRWLGSTGLRRFRDHLSGHLHRRLACFHPRQLRPLRQHVLPLHPSRLA